MARTKRADEAGAIYHMLNRANRRDTIIHKQADFEAFKRILAEALERVKLKVFAYCILSNHWHLCGTTDLVRIRSVSIARPALRYSSVSENHL